MQITISITKRWQVHIPKSVRQTLSLQKTGQLAVQADKGRLVLTPIPSRILSLAGKYEKYAQGKKIDLNKIRDYIDYSKA